MTSVCPPRLRNSHRAGFLLGVIGTTLLLAAPAWADLGKWSPARDWSRGNQQRYPVHMILLPGDGNPFHSRVLWFQGQVGDSMLGGQWGWRPLQTDCEQYPDSAFALLNAPVIDMNPFCSGTALLADSRVMVLSGTSPVTGLYGENKARIFNPGTGPTDIGNWSTVPNMNSWRWYATAISLRDGRIGALSGSQHRQHRLFGGFLNGAAPSAPRGDTLRG